jgi:8-oxo-dGTP diphosphatase
MSDNPTRTRPRDRAPSSPPPAVAVVIFVVREGALRVLLVHRTAEPDADRWALPGGYLLDDESLDAAASRVLVRETGVADVYLEQLYTFDTPPSAMGTSSLMVSYFALVDAKRARLEPRETWQPAWFPVADLPAMAFQNDAVIDYALRRLRAKLEYSNVVYSLMPEEFTLTDMQRVYEVILGEPLDKRNFRRRILSLGIVQPTAHRARGGAHRPAQLYTFVNRSPTVF